jgi:serine/threonine protein kinase
VVPIHDYGEIDGRLFVSMRLIKGRDLDAVLADGPMDPARAVRIIDQAAKALHAAHKVGLIHRDIKPSNILLDDDDFAYLIDFGIARAADETRMTKSGHMIGTFQYIAPERLDSQIEEDARADIYSLACVLYEALTGEPPFAGRTTAQLMFAHVNTPPPRPSTTQAGVPPQVDKVIATGMAKDPNQRYATTIELADAARDAITVPIARPTPSPPTLPATEQAPLPPTQRAGNRVTAQPRTLKAESLASAKPAPPQPTPPIPTMGGGISRRTTIALIVGAIALVAVIALAIGIPALVKQRPSGSSQSSSSSPTSSSFPTSTSKSIPTTTTAPSATPGAQYHKSIADYFTDNHITQTPVHRGDPGSPTINLPMPPGWQVANESGASYGTIVLAQPANPSDPPTISALVAKLDGNVDPAKIIEYAPSEVQNLPGAQVSGDGTASTLSGFQAWQISGTYVKDGKTRFVGQKTVVIPRQGTIFVLQFNADGLASDQGPLTNAMNIVDDQTTITVT